MNSVAAQNLVLPDGAIDTVLKDVSRFGAAGVETGVFLLGERRDPMASVVALAGEAGIGRSERCFSASSRAVAVLFDWASEQNLLVRAQVHSHRDAAFLSRTDVRHGFAVQGFVTCVVPWFVEPPTTPAEWGWWRYDTEWQEIAAPAVARASVRTVAFDARAVLDV